MSPKDIANRIKAKGLQKLRWYCQMCGKQCRDENGFKCHLTSESHRRQMEVFGQNPHRVIQGFSEEFETTFMEHLKRCHPFSRVAANVVYNEYIQDRNHIHMNATKWLTLTEFVKYLGREGKCKVEDTPKGWFITLIHKDPEEEAREKKRARRERAEKEEAERHARALEKQIERARKESEERGEDGDAAAAAAAAASDVKLEDLQALGGFTLPAAKLAGAEKASEASRPAPAVAFDDDEGVAGPSGRASAAAATTGPPHKKSKLEELMERDMAAKKQQAAAAAAPGRKGPAPWLSEGIVVKVMSKALKEHGYYKQKGVVTAVIDGYIGEIEMLGSGDVVRVDQAELETVVPAPGGRVAVVAGPARGAKGTLVAIDEKAYAAEVRITDPRSGEKTTMKLEYEDFSKLAG